MIGIGLNYSIKMLWYHFFYHVPITLPSSHPESMVWIHEWQACIILSCFDVKIAFIAFILMWTKDSLKVYKDSSIQENEARNWGDMALRQFTLLGQTANRQLEQQERQQATFCRCCYLYSSCQMGNQWCTLISPAS